MASNIERSQAFVQRNLPGIAAYKLGTPPAFDAGDATLIKGAGARLDKAVDDFVRASAAAKDKTGGAGLVKERMLRTALDEVHAVGAATARFNLLSPDDRNKMRDQDPNLDVAMQTNRVALEKAAPALDGQVGEVLASPFERTVARSVIAETLRYSDPGLADAERSSQQALIYAANGVSTPAANTQAHQTLGDLKTWLLRRIDACPPTGECCLEAEIAAIQVPTGEAVTEDTTRAAEKLVRALMRYLLDCICAALLPPCPSCEDPGVKLACLQIDDCNVCQICNLERTFLLTEHNLRYWMPFLHSFGEALERLCCDFAGRFRIQTPSPRSNRDVMQAQYMESKNQTAFFESGGQFGELAAANDLFPNLVRLTGLDVSHVRSSLNIGGNVARAGARDPVMTALAARYTDADFARQGGRNALAKALAPAPAPEMVRTEVDRAAEGLYEKFAAQFKDVTSEIDKRLSPKAFGQVKAIVDLKEQLEAQRKINENLTGRLEALEKRKSP
jgi:hypothetical protein